MVNAPFNAYLNTPNKSIRQNVPRRGVVLHHAAMTSYAGLERLAMGAKQVSATSLVKDDYSSRLMTDQFRAWSLSSAWGDSSFRSVETCNQSTNGWTISDESHWELARLVAYWAELDGFWPHRSGPEKTWTVIGHREAYTIWDISYGTACPGGMDLDLVTYRAQQLLKKPAAPAATPTIEEEIIMALEARYIYRNETGYAPEYMLLDEDLPPLATDPNQRGYRVSADVKDGEAFGVLAGVKGAPLLGLNRAKYIKTQEWARRLYDQKHPA